MRGVLQHMSSQALASDTALEDCRAPVVHKQVPNPPYILLISTIVNFAITVKTSFIHFNPPSVLILKHYI